MKHLLTEEQLLFNIVKCLRENRKKELFTIIEELQPYDIANVYEDIPQKFKSRFLLYLNNHLLADVIQEVEDTNLQYDILNKLPPEKKADILDLMDNDDLAHLLHELPEEKAEALLSVMKHEESTIVQNIMTFPAETAGRLMTNRFVWIKDYYTVREAIDKLKNFASYAETISYLYVIDENRKLVGVVSYRDLLLAELDQKIKDIMFTRVIYVSAYTDQEEAAAILERYDFLALPVVDDNHILLGIITFDDMLDVIIEEANEDIEKLSASGKAIDFDTKASVAAWRRLPWLVLLLVIGVLSGSIISYFEDTLSLVVALTFFMPMISGMTGNTGTQSLAVVVRGLAGQKVNKKEIFQLIYREFLVGLLIGIVCGLLISAIAYLWQGNFYLGLVVGLSLLLTLIIGTLSGTIIPLILYKINIDPAIASGPLITTLNDIFSLITYFTIATLFLDYLL
ncbi:magnesium transporter [Pallidibacillus thermolactis]|jgi:magnesium transporter|uniref:magnesium transporter n=1 Tax=Pallidibacillus thermolactis TaxID=251051 RepID=UPI0021D8C209|nr:magnesium transporter [Pallidibacillus thermolactis]MCU9602302.1 magnesium transporter [Pallidibacillus thermolactis subsp. kokeshiiformis]